MFGRQLVIRPYNRTLKQAPNAFHAVGVNVAAHPFVRSMVNRLMARVGITCAFIANVFVRVDRFGFRVG